MLDVLEVVLQQVRRFGRERLDAIATDRRGAIDRETLSHAARMGLFGLGIPGRYGGLGLSLEAVADVVAELARFDRSVAVTVGLHSGLGTRPLLALGSESLRAEWLPRFASGEAIAAFCATEPGAGSDLTRLSTQARVDGDALVLDGEKSYVTNGGFAGAFTVLAHTPDFDGAKASSLVLVPRDAPGVEVGAEERKLGIRGSSTVTVHFDSVRVPREHLLGAAGAGLENAHDALVWGRTLMSAGCVGTARTALELTEGHTRARRQFGKPLVAHGGVQEHLAFMEARLFAMDAVVRWAAELADDGAPGAADAAAIAKVFCSEGAFQICDRAIQLHGALGFLEDSGVALLARDCRVTRIFEGANDVLLFHHGVRLVLDGVPGEDRDLGVWLKKSASALRSLHGVKIVRQPHAAVRVARAHLAIVAARLAVQRGFELGGSRDALLSQHAAHSLSMEAEETLRSLLRANDDMERDRRLIENEPGGLATSPRSVS